MEGPRRQNPSPLLCLAHRKAAPAPPGHRAEICTEHHTQAAKLLSSDRNPPSCVLQDRPDVHFSSQLSTEGKGMFCSTPKAQEPVSHSTIHNTTALHCSCFVTFDVSRRSAAFLRVVMINSPAHLSPTESSWKQSLLISPSGASSVLFCSYTVSIVSLDICSGDFCPPAESRGSLQTSLSVPAEAR